MIRQLPFLPFLFSTIVAKYYTTFDLEKSENLCEKLHEERLQFGETAESAIRLNLYAKKSFHCQFEVFPRTPKHGVVAVIQEMNFRADPGTGKCIDYIMFKGTKFGGASKKYCGVFDVETAMERYVYQGNTYIGMATKNAYQNDADDGVLVIVHMNMNDDNYFDSGTELVLTSYTDCHADPPWFYKPCVYKNLDTICIEDVYFNDGFVNCPFRGCVDEGTCVPPLVKYYAKRIFAGVLVAIFLSVTLPAVFLYICVPHRNYNVSDTEPPPNYMLPPLDEESEASGGSTDEEMRKSSNASEECVEENWDKPPLYETLFPDGQRPFSQV